MKLTDVSKKLLKAGFIPYIKEDEQVKFMFMISSDAKYGGSLPMISKGHIDPGETPQEAAIREAEEELGLIKSNLKAKTIAEGWRGIIKGNRDKYGMVIYFGEVKDKFAFGTPEHETKSVVWMTEKEFLASGRETHKNIVSEIAKKVK